MQPFELGPFKLKEHELAIFGPNQATLEQQQGMRACQDYGKVFGQKLEK